MEKFIQLLWLASWPLLVVISFIIIKKCIRKFESRYKNLSDISKSTENNS